MREIILNNQKYKLIKNYKDAFNEEEVINKFTDYFDVFDYVVGDIAYGKLRLKGFYNSNNKKVSKINNFTDVDKYLQNNCAVECKHFILEKERSE